MWMNKSCQQLKTHAFLSLHPHTCDDLLHLDGNLIPHVLLSAGNQIIHQVFGQFTQLGLIRVRWGLVWLGLIQPFLECLEVQFLRQIHKNLPHMLSIVESNAELTGRER